MSAKTILGQTAEIAGPKKAFIIPKPEVAVAMIKRAKRPLLVVGAEAPTMETADGDLIDTAIEVSKSGMSVVATGHMVGEFRRRGAEVHSMPLMNLGDRLRDPEWMGLDGKGGYDLAVFVGFSYYLEWLVENGLKSFAKGLTTISLSRSYQPNAGWSLGTMKAEEWKEVIDVIVKSITEAS
ncbi:CO dehydrogenase/acetyl-CoA synthase complex subunit epsilon [Candidatus Bathyarchaeota archaeon]|nr:CO dehydrogenase/acetyl-CoA synthase complex subunit epsilon [Candidatus Bathyarchaeota archaeon]